MRMPCASVVRMRARRAQPQQAQQFDEGQYSTVQYSDVPRAQPQQAQQLDEGQELQLKAPDGHAVAEAERDSYGEQVDDEPSHDVVVREVPEACGRGASGVGSCKRLEGPMWVYEGGEGGGTHSVSDIFVLVPAETQARGHAHKHGGRCERHARGSSHTAW